MQRLDTVGPALLAVRQSEGTGAPVLLCHGNSMGAAIFDPLLDSPLGARYRMIAVDLPGHGDSPRNEERYTPPQLVQSLVEVAEALRLKRPALVGHSLGGHLMIGVAQQLGAVRGVFAFGTPLLQSAAAAAEAFLPHPAVGLLFQGPLREEEQASLAALLAPGGGDDAALVLRLLRRTDARFRSVLASALLAGHADEVAIARGLDAPVALAHGSDDPLVNLAYLERLELPNLWRGKVQIIDGAGHVPQLDAPDRLHSLLGEFLDEVA